MPELVSLGPVGGFRCWEVHRLPSPPSCSPQWRGLVFWALVHRFLRNLPRLQRLPPLSHRNEHSSGSTCVGCHNSKLASPAGGLALDVADIDKVGENPQVWEKTLRKLHARAMPPPTQGGRRPDEASYESLISYLEASLDRAASANPNPGRSETFHRINRAQYRNAIRDLLTLDVDVSSMLPADNASHGFDNVNVSGLSPTLVEQYLSASRAIARLAVGRPPRSAEARTVVLPIDYTQDHRVEGLPYGTRGGTVFEHNFPVDGEYLFQIQLSRNRDGQIEGVNEPQDLELSLDGERLQVFSLKPNAAARNGSAVWGRRDRARLRIEGPVSSQGGSAQDFRDLSKESRTTRNGSTAIQGGLQRSKPRGDFFSDCRGSVQSGRSRSDAKSPACLYVSAVERLRGTALRKGHHRFARATRLPAAACRCGSRKTAQVLSRWSLGRWDI